MSRARLVGLCLTALLVVVLLGSLVLGLGGRPGRGAAGVSTATAGGRLASGERVRVEVLNAAGVPGLARTATRQLRDLGFDVVYFGNGRRFSPDTSRVLDRVGKPAMARSVADAMEIERVESRPDTTLYLDVTVVIGRDWAGARQAAPDSAATEPGGG